MGRSDATGVGHPCRPGHHSRPGGSVDAARGRIHAGSARAPMTTVVFLGPTLLRRDAEAMLPAAYLPPVRQGDVYRAVRETAPRAIGIIDGAFLDVASVWHREIL